MSRIPSDNPRQSPIPPQYTVLTWNVLAPCYAKKDKVTAKDILDTSNRMREISQILFSADADLLCLQEFQDIEGWSTLLHGLGYDVISRLRGSRPQSFTLKDPSGQINIKRPQFSQLVLSSGNPDRQTLYSLIQQFLGSSPYDHTAMLLQFLHMSSCEHISRETGEETNLAHQSWLADKAATIPNDPIDFTQLFPSHSINHEQIQSFISELQRLKQIHQHNAIVIKQQRKIARGIHSQPSPDDIAQLYPGYDINTQVNPLSADIISPLTDQVLQFDICHNPLAQAIQHRAKFDGCLIAFKRDKFQLVGTPLEVDLNILAYNLSLNNNNNNNNNNTSVNNGTGDSNSRIIHQQPSIVVNDRLLRDNIALAVCLQPIPSNPQDTPHSPFIISTTHLYWNPSHEDVKLAQTFFILRILKAMREQYARHISSSRAIHVPPLPVILAGDTNSIPDSQSIQLIQGVQLVDIQANETVDPVIIPSQISSETLPADASETSSNRDVESQHELHQPESPSNETTSSENHGCSSPSSSPQLQQNNQLELGLDSNSSNESRESNGTDNGVGVASTLRVSPTSSFPSLPDGSHDKSAQQQIKNPITPRLTDYVQTMLQVSQFHDDLVRFVIACQHPQLRADPHTGARRWVFPTPPSHPQFAPFTDSFAREGHSQHYFVPPLVLEYYLRYQSTSHLPCGPTICTKSCPTHSFAHQHAMNDSNNAMGRSISPRVQPPPLSVEQPHLPQPCKLPSPPLLIIGDMISLSRSIRGLGVDCQIIRFDAEKPSGDWNTLTDFTELQAYAERDSTTYPGNFRASQSLLTDPHTVASICEHIIAYARQTRRIIAVQTIQLFKYLEKASNDYYRLNSGGNPSSQGPDHNLFPLFIGISNSFQMNSDVIQSSHYYHRQCTFIRQKLTEIDHLIQQYKDKYAALVPFSFKLASLMDGGVVPNDDMYLSNKLNRTICISSDNNHSNHQSTSSPLIPFYAFFQLISRLTPSHQRNRTNRRAAIIWSLIGSGIDHTTLLTRCSHCNRPVRPIERGCGQAHCLEGLACLRGFHNGCGEVKCPPCRDYWVGMYVGSHTSREVLDIPDGDAHPGLLCFVKDNAVPETTPRHHAQPTPSSSSVADTSGFSDQLGSDSVPNRKQEESTPPMLHVIRSHPTDPSSTLNQVDANGFGINGRQDLVEDYGDSGCHGPDPSQSSEVGRIQSTMIYHNLNASDFVADPSHPLYGASSMGSDISQTSEVDSHTVRTLINSSSDQHGSAVHYNNNQFAVLLLGIKRNEHGASAGDVAPSIHITGVHPRSILTHWFVGAMGMTAFLLPYYNYSLAQQLVSPSVQRIQETSKALRRHQSQQQKQSHNADLKHDAENDLDQHTSHNSISDDDQDNLTSVDIHRIPPLLPPPPSTKKLFFTPGLTKVVKQLRSMGIDIIEAPKSFKKSDADNIFRQCENEMRIFVTNIKSLTQRALCPSTHILLPASTQPPPPQLQHLDPIKLKTALVDSYCDLIMGRLGAPCQRPPYALRCSLCNGLFTGVSLSSIRGLSTVPSCVKTGRNRHRNTTLDFYQCQSCGHVKWWDTIDSTGSISTTCPINTTPDATGPAIESEPTTAPNHSADSIPIEALSIHPQPQTLPDSPRGLLDTHIVSGAKSPQTLLLQTRIPPHPQGFTSPVVPKQSQNGTLVSVNKINIVHESGNIDLSFYRHPFLFPLRTSLSLIGGETDHEPSPLREHSKERPILSRYAACKEQYSVLYNTPIRADLTLRSVYEPAHSVSLSISQSNPPTHSIQHAATQPEYEQFLKQMHPLSTNATNTYAGCLDYIFVSSDIHVHQAVSLTKCLVNHVSSPPIQQQQQKEQQQHDTVHWTDALDTPMGQPPPSCALTCNPSCCVDIDNRNYPLFDANSGMQFPICKNSICLFYKHRFLPTTMEGSTCEQRALVDDVIAKLTDSLQPPHPSADIPSDHCPVFSSFSLPTLSPSSAL